MAKIYRTSDKIKIKIGGDDGIILTVSPLNQHQKTEIQQHLIKSQITKDPTSATLGVTLALKYAVKAIDGIEDMDGNKYQLALENNILTDECVQDLMNMEMIGPVMMVCSSLSNGVPKKFVNNITGEDLPDVEIIKAESEKKVQPTK